MIYFFVPGDPAAQGRPRARVMRLGRKMVPQVYDSGSANDWKARVMIIARPLVPKAPMLGPIKLNLIFMIERPERHYKGKARVLRPEAPLWHTIKPDKDNFEKAVLDALTAVRMWHDDSQVCDGHTQKIYTNDGKPGCLVSIEQKIELSPYELCLTDVLCQNQDFPALSETISTSPA